MLPTLIQRLERHQRRRLEQVPTVSLLCGPVERASETWDAWSRGHGFVRHTVGSRSLKPFVCELAAAIDAQTPSRADAVQILSGRLDVPCADPFDVQQAAKRARLQRWFETIDQGDVQFWLRAVAVLVEMAKPSVALLAMTPDGAADRAAWLAESSETVVQIASHIPSLPIALAVDTADADHYFRHAPESKTKALLREGEIHLSPDPFPVDRQVQGVDLENTLRLLDATGAASETFDLLLEAARCLQQLRTGFPVDAPAATQAGRRAHGPRKARQENHSDQARAAANMQDQARSAAERFLYNCLQDRGETRGVFRLNLRLDFDFGPNRAEVDLASRELSLAVEVDGVFHFQDQDAYRRDRRKDAELQKHGFLVLRFLAEDVVERCADVMDTIVDAVRFRRKGDDE